MKQKNQYSASQPNATKYKKYSNGLQKLILQNTNLKIITVAKIMAYNTLL